MAQLTVPPSGGDPTLLAGDKKRHRRESFFRWFFFSAAFASILVSVAIVVSLLGEAWNFLSQVELGQLWTSGWFPRRCYEFSAEDPSVCVVSGKFDLRTIILGSLIVTGVAMIVAAPLGLGSAIYLSEYANPRARRILKPIIEILAGIPSVVLGFFALSVISPGFVQRIWNEAGVFSLLAAGIGVGILTIPIVASIAEDALKSVPDTLRDASIGVGARKFTTTVRVVFPAAISGIVAALIVGMSRALGETMVVALAAGAVGGGGLTWNPLDPGQTMTAAMMSLATGSDQVKGADLAFPSLFFVGLLLFLFTLALNSIGERFVRRIRTRF